MRRAWFPLLLLAAVATATESTWPGTLPALRLSDPLGRTFSHTDLAPRGVVVVATAPSLAQGDAQIAWDAALKEAKPAPDGPHIVMLEDMSQSWFRPLVIGRMKETYKATSRILLLLDESGATRKALKVPDNATIAFAFGPGGNLVMVETGKGTVERARKLLEAASGAP